MYKNQKLFRSIWQWTSHYRTWTKTDIRYNRSLQIFCCRFSTFLEYRNATFCSDLYRLPEALLSISASQKGAYENRSYRRGMSTYHFFSFPIHHKTYYSLQIKYWQLNIDSIEKTL